MMITTTMMTMTMIKKIRNDEGNKQGKKGGSTKDADRAKHGGRDRSTETKTMEHVETRRWLTGAIREWRAKAIPRKNLSSN